MAFNNPGVFAFGLLGNIISFMVYLAPVPTFVRICKKKSTEGFQSIPYIAAIFSSMLWIYYAMVKTNTVLLITINGFGCVVEAIYVVIFLAYATKQAKMSTLKLVVFLILGGFSAILLFCTYLVKTNAVRIQVLGWICVAFAVIVFAAPLSVMRLVIRTKSVEFMPFFLSLSLTMNAVAWGMYGLLKKDLYVLLPNVLGLVFGVAQMALYAFYKNKNKGGLAIIVAEEEMKQKVPAELSIPANKQHDTNNTTNDARIDMPPLPPTPRSNEDDEQAAAAEEIRRTTDDHHEVEVGEEEEDHYLHGRAHAKSCKEEIVNIGGPTHTVPVPMVQCAAH